MPDLTSELDQTQPCTHNPLGAKGCGEAGSIGAPAAIVAAVLGALRPLGVTDIAMPLTPARVWAGDQGGAKSLTSRSGGSPHDDRRHGRPARKGQEAGPPVDEPVREGAQQQGGGQEHHARRRSQSRTRAGHAIREAM